MVDYGLKPGSTHLCVPVCANDTAFSKPTPVRKNAVDDQTQTNNVSCVACVCGSVSLCVSFFKHVIQGSTFKSIVTRKSYTIVSSNCSMTCTTENVIYLIS